MLSRRLRIGHRNVQSNAVRADQQRPRLVIVTYHFPPDGSVGGLRWAGFSKYLAALGWDVHIVTSGEQNRERSIDGVKVHSVKRAHTLNDLYNKVMRNLRPLPSPVGANAAVETASVGTLQSRSRLFGVRTMVAEWLAFPDYSRGWLARAALRTRKLVRKIKPELVITSGPPHSPYLAGLFATLGTGIPHLLDFRDPWVSFVSTSQLSKLPSGRFQKELLSAFERLVFRQARGIIANTSEFAEVLKNHLPNVPVIWIRNGVDPGRLPARTTERFPGFSLAYVGTLYIARDLGPVLKALALLFQRVPEARALTKLRVAGHISDLHEARLRDQARTYGVEDNVEVLGVLRPADALELLNRSSLAIVLAQQQELQIPAKMYESTGLGVPTLVISEMPSASGREAERIGAFAVEEIDIAGICRFFEQVYTGQLKPRNDPKEPIDYPHLAQRMDGVLRSLADGRVRVVPETMGQPTSQPRP